MRRPELRLPLVVGIVCLLGSYRVASAGPLPAAAFGTHWYSVHIMGNRSGFSEQTLRETAGGYETVERTLIRIQLEGKSLSSGRTETRCYDSTLRLMSIEQDADQIGRRTHVTATRAGNQLQVTKTTPDGVTNTTVTLDERFGRELEILAALAAGRIQPGWQQTFTTYDCDLGRVDEVTAKATERLTRPEPAWLLLSRSQLLGLETKTWLRDDGVVSRQEVPAMMGMSLVLVTEQQAQAELEPLLLSSSLAIDRDLGEAEKLRLVRLHVSGPGASEVFPTTARQTVEKASVGVRVTVSAAHPPAHTVQLPVTDPKMQPLLAPSDMCQSGDPLLRDKARSLVGSETDAWAATRLLLRWVHRQVEKVESEPRPMSALEVIKAMRGDCTEHSILMAALCQSVGIPVRVVCGLAYSARAYHYHAWNEVYVGEWVQVDATWGEECVDAGHLEIASAALDSASMARMSLAASKSMGSITLKALEWN